MRIDELPEDWRAVPPPESTQAFGDARLGNDAPLALTVPSVIIPAEDPAIEWNVVINPTHASFATVRTSPGIEILRRFFAD